VLKKIVYTILSNKKDQTGQQRKKNFKNYLGFFENALGFIFPVSTAKKIIAD
jgi:hypothetical protein